jgi:hypothetical protein
MDYTSFLLRVLQYFERKELQRQYLQNMILSYFSKGGGGFQIFTLLNFSPFVLFLRQVTELNQLANGYPLQVFFHWM